jgi:hypothetical protein
MFPGFPAVRPPAAALAVGTRDDLAQRRFVPVRQLHLVDVAARGHTWRAPCAGTTTGKAHSADDRGPPVIVGRWCDSGLGFAGKWTQRLLALVTIASISSRSPSAVLHARWWPGLFKVDPKSASTDDPTALDLTPRIVVGAASATPTSEVSIPNHAAACHKTVTPARFGRQACRSNAAPTYRWHTTRTAD